GSPYKIWIDYLESKDPPVKEAERVPIAWLEGGAGMTPTPNSEPPFQIPQRATAILGAPGKGKSIIAFHLLAQYVKRRFTVVFINYKKATSRKGRPRDPGPSEHSELLDFAGVIQQATDTRVVAKPWHDLANAIEANESARKSANKERLGSAYYTEFSPGPDEADLSKVCLDIVGSLVRNVIFCFDEALNQVMLDSALRPELEKTMNYIFHELRSSHGYAVLIHQDLSQLADIDWRGFGDDCCYLITALAGGEDETDGKAYASRFYRGTPFLQYDVPLKRLEKFAESKFAFVPPKDLRGHSPIPLEIPKYRLIERGKKPLLEGMLPWDTIDYHHWERQANHAVLTKE
ncbi:MAG TPA: hypothetical protein VGR02_18840, partial [Thermoanaerobaculia bacterium]|nr:hypothetical protein [Thermoanaerobaculia bacterium]